MTFLVVDTLSPYNAIIGLSRLNMMESIVSTRHLLVKFPTRFGVRKVRGDQQVARQCYHVRECVTRQATRWFDELVLCSFYIYNLVLSMLHCVNCILLLA
ncbi:hypothetical protein CFOL_v3_00501 [Cephalotus follicularis]|uniref:Uncharacterized protein n=1 Tax=Cephalotus follicularis TaxID=3775 RepID=A0A1Q3AN24_CEPFO|nr:hypothetical protein CFOL_v3_00501 [Cephalotus follicularis]